MDVDTVLGAADPSVRQLAQGVREVIRRSCPELDEVVKWGAPNYTLGGRLVACIMVYDDHVNLGFFQGAKLKSARLEGTGKGLRHVKVRRATDIDEKEFRRLLKAATKLAAKQSPSRVNK